MKRILFVLGMLPAIAWAQKEKPFSLEGKIAGLPDSSKVEWIYLQYRVNGEWKIDSTVVHNGSYKFKGSIAEPVLARMRVKFADLPNGRKHLVSNRRDMTGIFIESGKQKVSSTDSFSNITVKGSKAHSIYAGLASRAKEYEKRLTPLYAKYNEYGKAKDLVNQQKVEKEIDAIDAERNEKVYGAFVKSNLSSPVALYALQQYAGYSIDADKIEPIFLQLPERTRQLPSAVEFNRVLEIAKKTGIGRVAMDFTQNDTLGKPVSLSSFRGKFLLIDFWASWCGPCRAENPNVVKVFDKYKDRNFHIIGVSLDRPGQKERWMKAIHDDGLAWTQVSDLKFWDNEVAKMYGVQAIPQNFLLDPEGKIIGRDLRGEELEKQLGAAIEGKKGF